jgi:hypothetical protein
MFGGNSNGRGQIWMSVNLSLQRALRQFTYYGDAFKVGCPTGSGQMMTLFEVAQELTRRLLRIFLRDKRGRRAGVRGDLEVPDGPPLAGSHLVLRVLPRR